MNHHRNSIPPSSESATAWSSAVDSDQTPVLTVSALEGDESADEDEPIQLLDPKTGKPMDIPEEPATSEALEPEEEEESEEGEAEEDGFPMAVISDIHANLEALQAVLDDIEQRGIERIICLGDLIGYGADPRACIDLVAERCEWALMGNHDFAAMYEPTNFNPRAETAAFWTRRELEGEPDRTTRARRWQFLGNLLIKRRFGNGFMCVHGSPRRPINEYIFAEDAQDSPSKMKSLFSRVKRCCLVGHTHVQGVFTDEPAFYSPAEIDHRYGFHSTEKAIVNVGSVGQPRDRDPRAGYALLHGSGVQFVRLEYDIDTAAKKITEVPELNNFFGQRLYDGR